MSETPINPQVQAIIDTSLAETKEFGWDEDDRKWSACGAVLKYVEGQEIDLNYTDIHSGIEALVTDAMKGAK